MHYTCITSSNGRLFINTLRPRQDGCHFADDIFKRIFLNENVWISINIHWSYLPGSNWQYTSVGSDNDLAPTRRQAIIWTNDGQVSWRIYATLGLNALISGKAPHHQISRNLEAARYMYRIFRSFWNLTGVSAALLPRRLSNFRTIQPF